MKTQRYPATLNIKIDVKTRETIDETAIQKMMSIGEVARDLLDAGIKARGLA